MSRYSLRTLLLVALIAGPLLALSWGYVERVAEERRAAEKAAVRAAEKRAAVRVYQKDKEALLRVIGWPNPPTIETEEEFAARRRATMMELYEKLRRIKAEHSP